MAKFTPDIQHIVSWWFEGFVRIADSVDPVMRLGIGYHEHHKQTRLSVFSLGVAVNDSRVVVFDSNSPLAERPEVMENLLGDAQPEAFADVVRGMMDQCDHSALGVVADALREAWPRGEFDHLADLFERLNGMSWPPEPRFISADARQIRQRRVLRSAVQFGERYGAGPGTLAALTANVPSTPEDAAAVMAEIHAAYDGLNADAHARIDGGGT